MNSKQATERHSFPGDREQAAIMSRTTRAVEMSLEEPSDPSEFDQLPAGDRVAYLIDLFGGDAAENSRHPGAATDERSPRFRLLTTRQMLDRPEPEWVIERLIPESGFVVLVGRNGVGKTFLALDIAACASLGRPWLGRTVRQAKALYVALEGMHPQRIEAWQSHNDVDALPDLVWMTDGIDLRRPADQDALIERVGESGVRFCVLDTLNRSISDFDENGSVDMGLIVALADRLRREAGCGLLVVHHTPRDGKNPRGHTSLEDAADTVLRVTDKPKGTHTLEVAKQRNGVAGAKTEFRIVTDTATGGAVIAAVGPSQHLDQLTRNEHRLVQALVQEPPILPATHGQIQQRVVDQGRLPKSSFNEALKGLVAKEILEREKPGKGALYDWTETGHTIAQNQVSNDGPA